MALRTFYQISSPALSALKWRQFVDFSYGRASSSDRDYGAARVITAVGAPQVSRTRCTNTSGKLFFSTALNCYSNVRVHGVNSGGKGTQLELP
jgi:hypothetical protein